MTTTTIALSSPQELLKYGCFRLRSWKGDYLHRPDSPQGVTTWNTGIGNTWTPIAGENGTVLLRSWKGDYLHRPDSPQGVTTWNTGIGNSWTPVAGEKGGLLLRSWKGDYLHRPDSPQGVTTWNTGIGNIWTVETLSGFAINNTSNASGTSFGWAANYTFKQSFIAQESGRMQELAIHGGNNQNPMAFKLSITASGETIFVKDYSGLKQRTTDWATPFPISEASRPIRAGETVVLSITPAQELGVEPIRIDNPNWPRYNLWGYGPIALRFYVKLNGSSSGATR